MISIEPTRLHVRTLRVAGSLTGLLWLGACADNDKPATASDAASPVGASHDAAVAGPDAAGPASGDAAAPAVQEAGQPAATVDAGGGVAVDASSQPEGSAPAASDSGTPDASATDAGAAPSARPLSTSLMLPDMKESPGAEPLFDVYRPSDMAAAAAATGRLLPVIVWANGGCFRAVTPWEPLLKRWAAAGFVVLGLSVKPGGGILDALGSTSHAEHGKQIDWVLEQANKPGSPYAGKIDTTMIVAAGNSCGGVTAMELASKDPRVRAVFVLSGSSAVGSANAAVVNAIKVPVGFVVGHAQEDLAAANALMDYQLLKTPTMLVNRSAGDHLTVSTDTMVLPEVAEIALNWMDLSLYGNKQAAAALKAPNVCAKCTAGMWTLRGKMLETLEK